MQVESEPAIILHRRDYRDSSLLLDVFSRDHGRVGILARGAKRPKGRWRGLLEPLRIMQLGWRGRGELKSLAQADPLEPGIRLAGLPLYGGFYLAELVLRLTARDDPQPGVFNALLTGLTQLQDCDDIAPVIRRFEYRLLEANGYGLPLEATEDGEAFEASHCYSFRPETGFRQEATIAPDYFSGAVVLALREEEFSREGQAGELRRLLARALNPHLGTRPMKSAETLRAMQKLHRSAGPMSG